MNLLRGGRGFYLVSLITALLHSSSAAADGQVTADELIEKGRPSNIFNLEQSSGGTCEEITQALNTASQHREDLNASDTLLWTGWEVTWTETQYRTLNGKTARIYVSDIQSKDDENLRLFNLRSRYGETLYESLFYVASGDEEATPDEGGALSTAFIAEHTKERSQAPGVVTIMPYVDALLGTASSELRAIYQPGNHFTANVISLHGTSYAIIGPTEMFLNYEMLRLGMPIFVVKLPQDMPQSFCRLVTR